MVVRNTMAVRMYGRGELFNFMAYRKRRRKGKSRDPFPLT